MELLLLDQCDILVFVSGDTDLAPVVRAARRLFPDRQTCFAFPYQQGNAEGQQLADFSFRLRPQQFAKHQLPDPLELPDGRMLR